MECLNACMMARSVSNNVELAYLVIFSDNICGVHCRILR